MTESMQLPLPYVSVVVPVYNGQDTIGACIESLLAQDYPADRYEIIIVDNNSKDRTIDIVRGYPVRLLSECQQSAYAARNTGIRVAKGDIIAFTDADCVIDRCWLSRVVAHFASSDVVGVAGRILPFPSTNLVSEFLGSMWHSAARAGGELFAAAGGNVAYRNEALVAVGLFDGDLVNAGDIDLSWRIQAHTGGRIVFDENAVVLHKDRNTVGGLFRQLRRYGCSEIILATIHKGKTYHQRTPRYHFRWMLRQVKALITYVLSFVYRCVTWPFHRRDRKFLLWPALWFVAEGGHLLGKVDGLIETRFFRRNPVQARADIVR